MSFTLILAVLRLIRHFAQKEYATKHVSDGWPSWYKDRYMKDLATVEEAITQIESI